MCSSIQGTQITKESVFISGFTINNIAPKLQKMLDTQNCLQNHIKNANANFFYSQPSTIPKDAHAKFHLFKTFGLRFMISSVAPTYLRLFTHILSAKSETVTLRDKNLSRTAFHQHCKFKQHKQRNKLLSIKMFGKLAYHNMSYIMSRESKQILVQNDYLESLTIWSDYR